MTAHLAEPLPECLHCERPTRRLAWTGNGGLCTDCVQSLTRARLGRYAATQRRRA